MTNDDEPTWYGLHAHGAVRHSHLANYSAVIYGAHIGAGFDHRNLPIMTYEQARATWDDERHHMAEAHHSTEKHLYITSIHASHADLGVLRDFLTTCDQNNVPDHTPVHVCNNHHGGGYYLYVEVTTEIDHDPVANIAAGINYIKAAYGDHEEPHHTHPA